MIKKIMPYVFLGMGVAVAYLSFDWAVGAVIHSRKVVLVPDLSAKAVNDALNLLSPLGLGLEKEGEQFDKRFPAGTIIRQVPAPGMPVRDGRIVRVTVSQGGETLFVPNVVGQPLRQAQTGLQNLTLSIGEIEHRPSLRYEKDIVMLTDPPSGAIIAKNGMLNLVLSDGPPGAETLLVPDFVGENFSKAKDWAAAHQLSVSHREETDIGKADGEVLAQSPVGDTPLRVGESLVFVVNRPGGLSTEQGSRIYYEIPQGANDRDIRITVIDERGEREVFRRSQAPGSKVDFHVQPKGHARARIYSNGVLVEEQQLQ
jgi:eukaryotic-like serine/threonine-protein kinase